MTDERVHLDELVLAAKGGDRLALGAWIRHSQEDVWRLCAALFGPDRAGPLTEKAFLRAYRSLALYEQGTASRLWLLGVAARQCGAEALRRRLGFRPAKAEDHQLFPGSHFRGRLAMALTGTLGLRYAEAAVVSGCSEEEIRRRVGRARNMLLSAARTDGSPISSGAEEVR